jgi:hypothetical protein
MATLGLQICEAPLWKLPSNEVEKLSRERDVNNGSLQATSYTLNFRLDLDSASIFEPFDESHAKACGRGQQTTLAGQRWEIVV